MKPKATIILECPRHTALRLKPEGDFMVCQEESCNYKVKTADLGIVSLAETLQNQNKEAQ
jgi:hypothetical protein